MIPVPAAAGPYQPLQLGTTGAVAHQFRTVTGWESHHSIATNPGSRKILLKMHANGMFTAVVIRNSRTSIVGPPEGITRPDDYARTNFSSFRYPFVLTNGGFFVREKSHKFHDVLPDYRDHGLLGLPLEPGRFDHYSVGSTSVTTKVFPLPTIHAGMYSTLRSEDGSSWLTSGPNFKVMLPEERNYTYVGPYNQVPGGLATSFDRNERLAVVQLGTSNIVFAYTCVREHGMRINELHALVDLFLQTYLRKSIFQSTLALNLDGGQSVFIGFQPGPRAPLMILA
ncbi:hypothetical protein PspLS_11992 [Pyricularia sp. CBS 133598]|nr:hypothetical protein PspLS_11992 [Pyricularia sp. CBS 133598]